MVLKEYIQQIVDSAVLKTKVVTMYTPNHGSSTGEPVEVTYYWDEYECEWTTKEFALKGYVFNQIEPLIRLRSYE